MPHTQYFLIYCEIPPSLLYLGVGGSTDDEKACGGQCICLSYNSSLLEKPDKK